MNIAQLVKGHTVWTVIVILGNTPQIYEVP